ncbi:hypothetical protein RHGRI_032130 [Rhododendron griersonianum]|uniref:Core-2/I-branching beta-1,6-N-acetylglucosaminyltransferase family protein n=1 Tax=Rhododendron griersonianum TaxID=479676 RepID=A0AAV6IGG6_9ERIC|nr:hypothetical protein RHGRI_032130 [Rhododendron griersonianum]
MKRSGRGREEQEKSPGSITKDFSIGLLRLVSVLIIFVVSVVVGFSLTSPIYRFFSLQTNQSYKNSTMAPMLATTSSKNFSVLKYEEEDCLSMGSLNLMDGMSDEELFWRASTTPKKVEYPCDRVPRVAFMFLTRGPLPMLPLWERFLKGHEKLFSIYVHARPGYELNVSNTSAFYGRQIPSQHVEWGSGSLLDVEMRLLANALLDFSNKRFVLLSESCIPIQNFPTVYQYLIGSSHSFVESYDNPTRDGRGRYRRWMWPAIRLSDWQKGSQWFEINRVLATIIISDTKYYPIFRNHSSRPFYPEEHCIPTFLHMFYGSLNENRTVTWVDWSKPSQHPATFGKANITERFVQSIRNNGTLCPYNSTKPSVCYLFARKFEPSALEPLLNLSSSHVEWGSGSLVDAERRLLANALLDFSNERFVLLSESCIPIQNFPTVYQYLTRSSHSFVESYYSPARYRRWMWPTISPLDWRTGSQWFEINRVLAATIVSDTKYYPVFRKHPKRSFHPEEHYIQTFLHMFHGSLNENRTVTWVDWSTAGLHPATFGKANITERFVQSIRNNGTLCSYNSAKTSVCYLFARKFEPSALEPLLNLSSSVMEF